MLGVESEAEHEERALQEEQGALAAAQQRLEEGVQRWRDCVLQDSAVRATGDVIAEKHNELVHTKVQGGSVFC